MPQVSVLIPAFEAAAFVHRAIHAVRAQTLTDIEAIVVDDGSTDATADDAAAAAQGDPRIRVLRLEENCGPARARNVALQAATGEWIAPLDADDLIAPQRFARLLEVAKRTRSDIVADNLFLATDPERPDVGRPIWPITEQVVTIDLARFIDGNRPSKGKHALGYLQPMIRRAVLQRHAIRYNEDLKIAEDYFLVAQLLAHGVRMCVISEPMYIYWERSGSLSRTPDAKHWRKIIEADQLFQSVHGDDLTRDAALALQRRHQEILDLATYLECRHFLNRQPLRAAQTLLQRPGSVRFLGEAVLAKFSPRKRE